MGDKIYPEGFKRGKKIRELIANMKKQIEIFEKKEIRNEGDLSKLKKELGNAVTTLRTINPVKAAELEKDWKELDQVIVLEKRRDFLVELIRRHFAQELGG